MEDINFVTDGHFFKHLFPSNQFNLKFTKYSISEFKSKFSNQNYSLGTDEKETFFKHLFPGPRKIKLRTLVAGTFIQYIHI